MWPTCIWRSENCTLLHQYCSKLIYVKEWNKGRKKAPKLNLFYLFKGWIICMPWKSVQRLLLHCVCARVCADARDTVRTCSHSLFQCQLLWFCLSSTTPVTGLLPACLQPILHSCWMLGCTWPDLSLIALNTHRGQSSGFSRYSQKHIVYKKADKWSLSSHQGHSDPVHGADEV